MPFGLHQHLVLSTGTHNYFLICYNVFCGGCVPLLDHWLSKGRDFVFISYGPTPNSVPQSNRLERGL